MCFGKPEIQHPTLQLIWSEKRWLTDTAGVTAVTAAFWLLVWAQVAACGQFIFDVVCAGLTYGRVLVEGGGSCCLVSGGVLVAGRGLLVCPYKKL